ncbi:precursor of CEP14 [Abrus precatorius]|uniref:Precursor of CEP14 n=1 Tax=Abrus precatorius TaxID=3816 RepID=A0A8B8KXM0_ABRPR|nr:precursor of CEP14 [Abrus precatorius]
MARPSTWVLLFILLFASLSSSLEGRKLLLGAEKQWKKANPSSRDSLFLSALPKGTVPPSSPSKKGHVVEVDEKLTARHLISIDRVLLRSVPSPGVGH